MRVRAHTPASDCMAGASAADRPILCARGEATLTLETGNATVCAVYAGKQTPHFLTELPFSVVATVVVAIPADGCAPLANAATVAGNFVVIERGACSFAKKDGFASDAGAAAVFIVQNKEEPPFPMDSFESVEIPAGMVSKVDGALLWQHANESATLTTGMRSVDAHFCPPCTHLAVSTEVRVRRDRAVLLRRRDAAHATSCGPIPPEESWANQQPPRTD